MEFEPWNLKDKDRVKNTLEHLVQNYRVKLNDKKIRLTVKDRDFMMHTIKEAEQEILEINKWGNGYTPHNPILIVRALEEFIEYHEKPDDTKERVGITIPLKKIDLKRYKELLAIFQKEI